MVGLTANNEEILEPCPFCGGTEQRVKSSGRWGWFVSCSCCAVGPSARNRDEAIIAWNVRADTFHVIEPNESTLLSCECHTCHWEFPQGASGWVGYIVCSNCKHQFGGVDEREWTCCPVCGARVER